MIQKAIAESLKEIDHDPFSKNVNLASKLDVNCAEFVFTAGPPALTKKNRSKGGNSKNTVKKMYVVKGT